MAKDPAFLFYSSDFYMATVGMTNTQVGMYIRLLCLQHQQGRLSEAIIKSITGNKPDPIVMSKFVQDAEGLYYNERLEKETEKRNAFVSSRRKNARSKQNDTANCAENEEHMHEHMQSQTNEHMKEHMENENENININNNNNQNTKGVPGGNKPTKSQRFERIWELFPRKQGKSVAFRAYERAVKSGVRDEDIEQGVRAYIAYCQRMGLDARYIKQGGTWFSQQAWQDDYSAVTSAQQIVNQPPVYKRPEEVDW